MRVIIADDEPAVRSALRLLLEEKAVIRVIAEASDSGELLQQILSACPDLLLLDWELPDNRPEDLVKQLLKLCPRLVIIALSSHPQMKPLALQTGVRYFICKSEPPEQLLTVLDSCYNKTE
jgi:DNA-binding NarL/FixJ family response regulator